MHEVPFNYMILQAIITKYQFSNMRELDINMSKKFVDLLLKYYEKENNIKFYDYDFDDCFDNFINKYEEMFDFDGEKIFINPEISYDVINYSLYEEEDIYNENEENRNIDLGLPLDNFDLLMSINAYEIEKMMVNFCRFELEKEAIYLKYMNNKDKELLKKLNLYTLISSISNLNLKSLSSNNDKISISSLPNNVSDAIGLSLSRREYESDIANENLDVFDEELWCTSEYYNGYSISNMLNNLYQYAIFSDYPLTYKMLYEKYSLKNIMTNDINNSNENVMDEISKLLKMVIKNNESDEEFQKIFYFRYLLNIEKYLSKHEDPDLILSRNRLIFALDNNDKLLYLDKNLNKESLNYLNKKVYLVKNTFKNEALFMIDELFNEESIYSVCYTSQKLIFIKTFYELTREPLIITTLNKYKDSCNYEIYSNIILSRDDEYKKTLK